MRNAPFLSLLLAGTVLAGCSLAPDFVMPDMPVPEAYKEAPPDNHAEPASGLWKSAEPMESENRGQWWKIFGDASLDALEEEALAANPSLQAAAARVEQSRALAKSVRPSFLPDLDIGTNAVRSQPSSANLAAFGNPNAPRLNPYTLYSGQGVLSYEADLFGRVRDNYSAFMLDADAQEAAYRSALLALQADVAQHYFSIREMDKERKLLRDTLAIRTEANRIMQRRFEVGAASEVDTSRTQSELAGTRAELLLLDTQRRQLENALAVLLGKMPSIFTLAEAPLEGMPPLVPPGLPSELLERRTDIAAAVSSMEAANKRIGVARTAFFPRLFLTASGGYQSTMLSDLFRWSSRTWALGQTAGSALTMSIFDSGRNFAALDASKAAYKEAVANYRQQVLVAFRDVEDNLTAQRLMADQSQQQEAAAKAATRTTELINKRYDQGDVDYFQVVDAQRVSLAARRAAVKLQGQRYLATISLIRALGGGWQPQQEQKQAQDMPPAGDSEPELTPLIAPEMAPDTMEEEEQDEMTDITGGASSSSFFESEFGSGAIPAGETDDDILPSARLIQNPMPDEPEDASENVPEKAEEAAQPAAQPPVDKQKPSSSLFDSLMHFDFSLPVFDPAVPEEVKGTVLETRDPAEAPTPSSTESSFPQLNWNMDIFDLDFNLGADQVPAGEALKKTSLRQPLLGTELPTAPPK